MLGNFANGLVFGGVVVLLASLLQIRLLMAALPPGRVRRQWCAMVAMILLFIPGYVGYLFFANQDADVSGVIVPVIFFIGACFVWLTAHLALQTSNFLTRNAILEQETVTDPLTGVFNRRYLDRRLEEEVARAVRHRVPMTILVLDIDHFKAVNDEHGHPCGDVVLENVARAAASTLRSSDIVARYGGEEFIVIAPQTDLEDGILLADRVLKSVASNPVAIKGNDGLPQRIKVTVSMGVACLDSECGTSDQLLRAADEALYRAKRWGRNRVATAIPGFCEPQAELAASAA